MQRIPAKIRKKAKKIKLLLLDVDGVLTDGSIVINGRGEEIKRFNVRDGEGIKLLNQAGIRTGLISGRYSRAVTRRARELGIRMVYQRVRDKREAYSKVKSKTRLADHEIAYLGDDLGDVPVLCRAGLAMAVKDGWGGLRALVDYVTESPGGCGAVREVAELLLRSQGKWEEITQKYYRS